MENQTRFDLNAAIGNWRQELAAQPNLAPDGRRELETHLCDAIAGFRQRGLNDEESFWLARRRVGQPQQIGEEFVKADPAKVWRERGFWMIGGLFQYVTLGSAIECLSYVLLPVNSNESFVGIAARQGVSVAVRTDSGKTWSEAGIFPNTKGIALTSLTPGTVYAVRIRAIGGSENYNAWSAVVSIMAT